ncbi:MAG: [acyl-carrier-protein] S-malonyltransferase [Chromatiaceae bacterium]|nr:MAG: [acyl-carrier-protein] S-malonyltransferase [Chromatiaceae bacterium]
MSRPIAFLFPGQGSQAVGMLADLATAYPLVQATFEEAGSVLGRDLWQLVSSGPAAELDRTETTQPAMLAAGVAVWRCWQVQGGPRPVVMAGHSLGEYTALVCAEALTFADAVALVAERARLMQVAVPVGQGAMAALLGLDDAAVGALCAEQAEGEVLEAVNYNAPGQVVIAGTSAAVARAVAAARAAGAKRAVVLPVSVPSHCALMRPAALQLAEHLAAIRINTPAIPVVHNVNAGTASDPAQVRELLARQLYSPVRWVECVQAIAAQGVTLAFEAGPGKVLTGLGKRIDRCLETRSLFDPPGVIEGLVAAAT